MSLKKIYISLIIILIASCHVFSQKTENGLDQYIRSRTIDKDGREIIGIIVPGIPPTDGHREPIAIPTRSAVLLSQVPAISWSFGCSATSAAMAAGYYDNNGYPDMYTGPTNAGIMPMNNSTWGTIVINGGAPLAQCPLSATRNSVDGRTTAGHVDDYWVLYGSADPDPYITNDWTEHEYGDCTADYMGTNQSMVLNVDGGTSFYFAPDGSPLYNYNGCEPARRDGCHGLRDFYESRGYTVIQNYSQFIYGYNGNTLGFTFDQFKQEIDSGRPVLIQLTGHTVLGYGYDDAGSLIYVHDTWDYSNHTMTWGGYYSGLQQYGVAVVELGPGTYIPTANFSASATIVQPAIAVTFTDLSILTPTSWSWVFSPNTVTYAGGTSSTSQNPQVSFDISGYYTVSLTATNSHGSDTETKANYIHVFVPGMWAGYTSSDWNTTSNWDDEVVPANTTNVTISPAADYWPSFTGDFAVGTQCGNLTIPAGAIVNIAGNFIINNGKSLTFSGGGELNITGNWTNNGTFAPGSGTVTFSGSNPSSVNFDGTFADITTYTRSTFLNIFSHIQDSIAGPSGSTIVMDVPIGFTFKYVGTDFTQVRICTKGWISFNLTSNSSVNENLFSLAEPNNTLAPWWDNLDANNSLSFVSYNTTGSTPNRVFTVEWHKVKTFVGATARITFQVKIFESSNIIEFHYGSLNGGSHLAEGASIGIEDATGGTNHFIEATTGSTASGISNLISPGNWPTVNYRFTPPPVIENFNNLKISKTGGSHVIFNCDVNIAGNLTVDPGAMLNVTFPRTLNVNGY